MDNATKETVAEQSAPAAPEPGDVPVKILEKLSQDKYFAVRCGVAKNSY